MLILSLITSQDGWGYSKDKINSFIGGLAAQGLEYAMGGNFTLNVLNFSMSDDNAINTGLMEMRFGRDGFEMAVGTGGANASLRTVINSMSGLNDTIKIGNAKISSLFENDKKLNTLNAINFLAIHQVRITAN